MLNFQDKVNEEFNGIKPKITPKHIELEEEKKDPEI